MAKAGTTAAAAAVTDEEGQLMFGGMTAEQRAGMTDAEIEGIDGDDADTGEEAAEDAETDADAADADTDAEADEGETEEGAEAEGEEAEGEEGDDVGDDASEGDEANAAGEAETGGDTDENAGEEEADDEDEDVLDLTRSVQPNEWQMPKDADEQLAGFSTQLVELADKFDAGDLTAREYHSQREALEDQRATLRSTVTSAKQAWGKAMGDWQHKTVKAFLRENKEYTKDETLTRMLDGEVRALQVKTNDPFNPRILRQAHANIQKVMGKTPAAKNGKQGGEQQNAGQKNGKEKTPVVQGKKKPGIPPTLARVPADEIEDANGGKFARLDRLSTKDPHAFEVEMSKMSERDRNEYLAGA